MKTSKLWFLLPWSLAIACGDDISEAQTVSGTADGSSSLSDTLDDSSSASNTITDATSGSMSDSLTADGSSSSSATSADSSSTTTTGDTDSTTTGTETGSDSSSDSGSDSGSESESGTTGMMSCMDDLACDDTLPCNGVETCEGGECVAGDPIVCDDGVACTVDDCDDNTAMCFAVAFNGNCDDGSFCNGVETCDPVADCQPGVEIACDDGVACTEDSCDEGSDACAFEPVNANCDDGTFCNGAESCDALLGCQNDEDFTCADLVACTLDTCDEANDECDHTPDNTVCGDGVICNGDEVCNPVGGCGAGTPVNCADDGVACTVESCDEMTGDCITDLDNTQCDAGQFCSEGGCFDGQPCMGAAECQDGLACNGAEVCAPAVPMGPDVCQAGPAMNCNDGIACTSDSCSEPGMCNNVPLNGLCSDNNPCDGSEVCVAASGCQEGTPLSCNDGVSCTIDVCINGFGCNNIADDQQCDDGLFCNGTESCDLVAGCEGSDPIVCPGDGIACTADSCSEELNGCVHEPDDALCGCGQECLPAIGGCGSDCNLALCNGHLYACGDCTDNDADCDIDDQDTNCFGPCSDNEEGLDGLIPGQDNAPCKHDCYWDGDSGSGNDDCYWSHECDPLEPSATTCEYDATAGIPGYPGNNDCANALVGQSAECVAFCSELAPNGCDCFGCCEVDVGNGASVTVYLGSKVDGNGDSTCDVENLENPDLCHPCTQVPACINTCDECEICFGGDGTLPPECGEQVCAVGQQLCGQVGQAACPEGEFCLTGCCQQF